MASRREADAKINAVFTELFKSYADFGVLGFTFVLERAKMEWLR